MSFLIDMWRSVQLNASDKFLFFFGCSLEQDARKALLIMAIIYFQNQAIIHDLLISVRNENDGIRSICVVIVQVTMILLS